VHIYIYIYIYIAYSSEVTRVEKISHTNTKKFKQGFSTIGELAIVLFFHPKLRKIIVMAYFDSDISE